MNQSRGHLALVLRNIKDKDHAHFDKTVVFHRALDQYPRAVVGTGRVYDPDADHRSGHGELFGVDRGGVFDPTRNGKARLWAGLCL